MGVTFSDQSPNSEYIFKNSRNFLRLHQNEVHSLVQASIDHRVPLFVDISGINSLMSAGLDPSRAETANSIVDVIWEVFSEDGICSTKEFLVVMCLLADTSWAFRLTLIFDLFKDLGTEEIMFDDIILLLRTVFVGLGRLWRDTNTKILEKDLHQWIETIANSLFVKLRRQILVPVHKEEFVKWAFERFKEKHTVVGYEKLIKLYESAN